MSKLFSTIKTKLGLLDLITFGKYKGCRVDSIVEQNDDYLRFMSDKGIIKFDQSVLDALKNKFSITSIAISYADDRSYAHMNSWSTNTDDWEKDIPF